MTAFSFERAADYYERHGGVTLIGTDMAEAVVKRLVENARNLIPFPLLLADSTGLPLADSSIGAAMASHVLYLVQDWRAAVAEGMRVLDAGGVLLVAFGGTPRAPWHAWSTKLSRDLGNVRVRPGVSRLMASPSTSGTGLGSASSIR